MKEIYIIGSVTASFFTYKDFGNYWNKNCSNDLKGIYNHSEEGEKTGSHTIKIIGWGNEIINGKEVPYWLCVNSWGKKIVMVFLNFGVGVVHVVLFFMFIFLFFFIIFFI